MWYYNDAMAKIDKNGFLIYEDTTFFKEGVFEYLGKEIDPKGTYGLRPNGVYKVYRPKSEITKKDFIESLNQKPIVDDHTVIGTGKGMVAPEKKNCGGVLSDVRVVGNELHGRLDIWSTKLIDKIRSGKRELSLCYLSTYKPQKGVFEGQSYDFIQSGLECGNHLALVDEARNGHECRVADGMYSCDAKIQLEKIQEEDMDLTKLSADELVEAIKGCSDECKAKVKDFLNTPTEGEKKAAEEAKKKAEEEAAKKAAEDEEAAKKAAEEEAKKKAAEDAEAAKKAEDEKKNACDAAIAEYKKAVALAERVEKCAKDVFGTVTCDGVTTEIGMAEKICSLDAASIPASLKGLKGKSAVDKLDMFLSMKETAPAKSHVADSAHGERKSFASYLSSL